MTIFRYRINKSWTSRGQPIMTEKLERTRRIFILWSIVVKCRYSKFFFPSFDLFASKNFELFIVLNSI